MFSASATKSWSTELLLPDVKSMMFHSAFFSHDRVRSSRGAGAGTAAFSGVATWSLLPGPREQRLHGGYGG